jgi:hypothetical protein
MKDFIWNSEDIRDTCKHSVIHENIREQNLDIVTICEIGRTKFSASLLTNLSFGKDFIWFCLPSHGRSGGILVGINAETVPIKDVDYGDFLVHLNLRSKKDGFEWSFVAVYGAAQESHEPAFLAELVRICDSLGTPMLIGGDFSILRSPTEKIMETIMQSVRLFSVLL